MGRACSLQLTIMDGDTQSRYGHGFSEGRGVEYDLPINGKLTLQVAMAVLALVDDILVFNAVYGKSQRPNSGTYSFEEDSKCFDFPIHDKRPCSRSCQ